MGNDVLSGSREPDTLIGGPGVDELNGFQGDDLIEARDGTYDWTDCDRGVDRLLLDRRDFFSDLCNRAIIERTAPAVAIRVGGDGDLRAYRNPPSVTPAIGCPRDAAETCTGTAQLVVDGRSVGGVDIAVPRTEVENPRIPIDETTLHRSRVGSGVAGELRLEVRQADGTPVRLSYSVRVRSPG